MNAFFVRRDDKVDINLGDSHLFIQRSTSILDTGPSSSFIHIYVRQLQLRKKVKQSTYNLKGGDVCWGRLQIVVTNRRAVLLASERRLANFHVAEKIATSINLQCDCSHNRVEAIRRRKRIDELDDGETVPFFCQPSNCSPQATPLPEDQQFFPRKWNPPTKHKCTNALIYYQIADSGSP